MAKRLALLVGTTRYEDDILTTLQAPEADLAELAEVLRSRAICGFDDVAVLLNSSAQGINVAVCEFYSKGKPDDLLLVYFSGHGLIDASGNLYLCACDTRTSLLRATALPAALLRDEMDQCRSRSQVLVLDCCHAGAFARDIKGGGIGMSIRTKDVFEGTGVGRVVLTASDATQFALEAEGVVGKAKQSVFTRYLVEALRSGAADVDGNGVVTVDEVYDFVYHKVLQENPQQTPGKWAYKQQGEIVLARNPNPIARPELLDKRLIDSMAPGIPQSLREAAARCLAEGVHDPRPGLALAALEHLIRYLDDDSRAISALARATLQEVEQDPKLAYLRGRLSPATDREQPPSTTPSPEPDEVARPSGSLKPLPQSLRPEVAAHSGWRTKAAKVALTGLGMAAVVAAVALTVLRFAAAGDVSKSQAAAQPSNNSTASGSIEVLANVDQDVTMHLDGRVIGHLPQVVTDVSPGPHVIELTGGSEYESYHKEMMVRPGASIHFGPFELRRKRQTLTIVRDAKVSAAKVFLIEDGTAQPITAFPHVATVRPGVKYAVEAHHGGSQFVQSVPIESSKAEYEVTVSADSPWRKATERGPSKKPDGSHLATTASAKPPALELSGNLGSCYDGPQRLQRSLGKLKTALQRCLSPGVGGGNDRFVIATDGSGAIVKVTCQKGTLPQPVHECFHGAIRSVGTIPELAGLSCPLQIAIEVPDN